MRNAPEITVPIRLGGEEGQSTIPAQLAGELRRLISETVLSPGDAVPSTRALAAHLSVSRGSVVAGYDQLLAEGYLSAVAGRSTVVNPKLRRVYPSVKSVTPPMAAEASSELDLRPGQPWARDVVGPAWKSAWRQASAASVEESVPALGLMELRAAWAEHLRRMRAVVRDPSQLAVTGGGREGFGLLLLALADGNPARLRVGVEEPGYPSLRKVPARLGAKVVPMRVDERGLRVADLPTGSDAPDVLVVTPSHQYPLGGSLPVDRRQLLLVWARKHRVVIVEDDYDSELRYASEPLPALASLDDPSDGRVVLLGTLSKTLTPTLAAGYLALPQWLIGPVAATREDLGQPVGLVTQRAVANYLSSGALRLHTQRMRNRYRRRRAQVVQALADVPGVRVYPMDGGLHAVVETVRPEAEIVADLTARGVRVSPLSQYWMDAGSSGIVFGFGGVDEVDLEHGLKLIAEAAAAGYPAAQHLRMISS